MGGSGLFLGHYTFEERLNRLGVGFGIDEAFHTKNLDERGIDRDGVDPAKPLRNPGFRVCGQAQFAKMPPHVPLAHPVEMLQRERAGLFVNAGQNRRQDVGFGEGIGIVLPERVGDFLVRRDA